MLCFQNCHPLRLEQIDLLICIYELKQMVTVIMTKATLKSTASSFRLFLLLYNNILYGFIFPVIIYLRTACCVSCMHTM